MRKPRVYAGPPRGCEKACVKSSDMLLWAKRPRHLPSRPSHVQRKDVYAPQEIVKSEGPTKRVG